MSGTCPSEAEEVHPKSRPGTPGLYHYKPYRRAQVDIAKRIKEISEARIRYDYQRAHVLKMPGMDDQHEGN